MPLAVGLVTWCPPSVPSKGACVLSVELSKSPETPDLKYNLQSNLTPAKSINDIREDVSKRMSPMNFELLGSATNIAAHSTSIDLSTVIYYIELSFYYIELSFTILNWVDFYLAFWYNSYALGAGTSGNKVSKCL